MMKNRGFAKSLLDIIKGNFVSGIKKAKFLTSLGYILAPQ